MFPGGLMLPKAGRCGGEFPEVNWLTNMDFRR